jgi:hypothetical protein
MITGHICPKHPELNGLRTNGGLCDGCKKIQIAKWRENNKSRISEAAKTLRQERRALFIQHYGGCCELCGLVDDEVMTIDHIWDNGAEHRKEVPANRTLEWLIKNNFPPGFRMLCFNCNHKAHQVVKEGHPPPMSLYTIQREITKWADINFPNRDAVGVRNKLKEELDEWAAAPDDAAELADVMILLLDWCHLKGVDAQAAINEKMGINVTRQWVFDSSTRTWNHEI